MRYVREWVYMVETMPFYNDFYNMDYITGEVDVKRLVQIVCTLLFWDTGAKIKPELKNFWNRLVNELISILQRITIMLHDKRQKIPTKVCTKY